MARSAGNGPLGDFRSGREGCGMAREGRLAFADALRMLTNRINIFVSLPIKKLSGLALQKQLDGIGKTRDSTSNPASAA